jgi:hypothetical protein
MFCPGTDKQQISVISWYLPAKVPKYSPNTTHTPGNEEMHVKHIPQTSKHSKITHQHSAGFQIRKAYKYTSEDADDFFVDDTAEAN